MTPPLSPDVLARLRSMLGAAAPAEHTRAPEGEPSGRLAQADRAMSWEAKNTPWLRAMYTSPMADSTYQLAGVPKSLTALEPWDGRRAGMVVPDLPEGMPERKGMDELFMHPQERLWDADNPWGVKVQNDHTEPRDTFLHEQGHRYGGIGGEGKAEAFMQAFDVLSKTGSDTAGMGAMLDSADSRFPGTRGMSDRLLREPLFADHPAAGGQGARRTATLEQIFGTHLRDK